MNRNEAKHLSEVLKAYSEGKEVECFKSNRYWISVPEGQLCFDGRPECYRIKPKLRPYANAKEFIQAQKEHGIYAILANIEDTTFVLPIVVTNKSITLEDTEYSYKECLDNLIWQDGHSMGILD